MTVQRAPTFAEFKDANGLPLANGKVYTYQAGTSTTPLAAYADAECTLTLPHPVILDKDGKADMYFSDDYYNVVVTDWVGDEPGHVQWSAQEFRDPYFDSIKEQPKDE